MMRFSEKIKNLPLILLLLSPNIFAIDYDYPIIKVVDGDTIEFEATFLPDPLEKKLSLRVYGVDTPEKAFRAHCTEEERKGEEATEYTKKLVANSKSHKIRLLHWDKFGGRVDGDLILDGKSLRESLLESGFARPYFGDKKESWCELNK